MHRFLKLVFSINFLYLLCVAAETAAIIFLCLFLPSVMSLTAVCIGVWILNVTVSCLIIAKGRTAEVNCALILLVISLPVLGAVIYFFTCIKSKNGGTVKIKDAKPQTQLEKACLSFCGIGGANYDRAEYFSSGEQYFESLFKAIENAKSYVYLDFFIIGKGKIFMRLASALESAAKKGVSVKIICDGIGSAFKLGKKEIKRLKELGAEVKIFHKLKPFFYSRLNVRDHRKIAVIDGNAVFLGGINIADEYANENSPYGYWKDSGVVIYGAAAKAFEGVFLAAMNGDGETDCGGEGKYRCLPFYDVPPIKTSFAETAFVYKVNGAKDRVHIMTPYFCPGEKLSTAMEFAALRGVDVKIIIPHIPDKKYAFELSKACAEKLMPSGVKFYEYTPGFMHAKVMVCDGEVYIGSYNFDFRSMRLNCECGVILDGEAASEAEYDFKSSMRLSAPLEIKKLSPFKKAVRLFLRLVSPLI